MSRQAAIAVVAAILAEFALLAYVAGVADRVAVQRDEARWRLDRVARMCAVRVSDGYAECRPGAIIYGSTTTTVRTDRGPRP